MKAVTPMDASTYVVPVSGTEGVKGGGKKGENVTHVQYLVPSFTQCGAKLVIANNQVRRSVFF